MSEQEQISQLSALFDGELQPQQAEMVIRRAVRDATMRGRWQRYALIGACLRGEPLAGANRPEGVAESVRVRLAAEADIIVAAKAATAGAARARGTAGLYGRGAMGGAIAAAVALVAVLVARTIGPAQTGAGVVVAQ
ncbi:MAG TPA: sigma-E factor negative regulatory protein, partial [Steroidobacteraceae bacterium]|nr:sigma-E factor negative regulatory protein [Steroidobacteraceae bacterium]